MIKSCRGVKQCNDGVNKLEKEKQRENFRTILGFKKHDIMNVTEETTLDSIKNAFEEENIQTHYRVLGYEIDIFFMVINLQWRLMKNITKIGILVVT